MKKQLLYSVFTLFSISGWSQNILLVDDNNYFPANTDTIVNDLLSTSFSNIEEYDIATEGAIPDAAFLSNYDLVIWYCSTDGADLNLWDEGQNGLLALNTYLYGGGKCWIIGTDVLYGGGYTTPTTFTSGSFAYDKMGLLSYDVQSRSDDGNLGVAQLDVVTGAPTNFSSTLTWIYPTSWYVDGVTTQNEMVDIYEMGPSTYVLAGKTVMTHNLGAVSNVMSSFFDPFEISTFQNRIEFLETSIDYLLNGPLGISNEELNSVQVYPNPASETLTISSVDDNLSFEVISTTGRIEMTGNGKQINIGQLPNGMYFLKTENGIAKFVKE